MKTIFITVFDGLISKNILRSELFEKLKNKKDIKIVLFVRDSVFDYYKKDFSSKRVFVEKIPKPDHPRLEDFLYGIKINSLTSQTALYRQKNAFLNIKKIHLYVSARFLRFLGHFNFWHNFLSFLYFLIPDNSFSEYIKKYNPDLFFLPNLVSSEDMRLMKEARKRGIRTVGMVKSWDNITGKPFLYLNCDKLIVQNEIVKDEAVKILNYPEDKIYVVGFIQYDNYFDNPPFIEKRVFFEEKSWNLNKKTILFSATGFPWTPNDYDILKILDDAIEIGKIRKDAQVISRMHPKYDNEYDLIKKLTNVIIDRPGVNAGTGGWEFEKKDVVDLVNSIYHSDICINTGSTMAIESIIFDKPTIGIAFDGFEKKKIDKSVGRFYLFEHNQKLVSMGGEDVAYNKDQLVSLVNLYFENPNHNHSERAFSVEKECWKKDGRTWERILKILLDNLNKK